MKKLMIAFCMMLGFAGVATAQTAAKATTAKPTEMKVVKKDATAKVVKMDKTKPVAANGLKADGTPDMRLKENKDKAKAAATTTGPKKKDGTPDLRYKENKKKN
ncbi:hypothetical protein BH11BAC5_BH11BAC5_42770 [soil metagenome]|jgi:myo-inositol-hexaphosphate 3-phosphohydrolase